MFSHSPSNVIWVFIVLLFDIHRKTAASYSNQYLNALSVEMKVTVISRADVSLQCENGGVKTTSSTEYSVFACIFQDGWVQMFVKWKSDCSQVIKAFHINYIWK